MGFRQVHVEKEKNEGGSCGVYQPLKMGFLWVFHFSYLTFAVSDHKCHQMEATESLCFLKKLGKNDLHHYFNRVLICKSDILHCIILLNLECQSSYLFKCNQHLYLMKMRPVSWLFFIFFLTFKWCLSRSCVAVKVFVNLWSTLFLYFSFQVQHWQQSVPSGVAESHHHSVRRQWEVVSGSSRHPAGKHSCYGVQHQNPKCRHPWWRALRLLHPHQQETKIH